MAADTLDEKRFRAVMDGVIEAVKELRTKIDAITKTLDTLAEAVVSCEEKVGDTIDRSGRVLNSKLNQHLNEHKQETKHMIKKQEDVLRSIDDLERQFLLPSLIIRGIPILQNENLYKHLGAIFNHVHFTPSDGTIDNVFRIPSKPNNKNKPRNTSAIVVRFSSIRQRTNFFVKYLQTKDLALKHLGMNGESRIFISECLTKRNAYILKEALPLKKNKIIHTVYTKNGRVFVREINDPTKQVQIDDVGMLNKYLHQQKAASSTIILHSSPEGQIVLGGSDDDT